MCAKRQMVSLFVILVLAVSAVAAEPVEIRLKWKPGEAYTYRFDMETSAFAEGETVNLNLSFDITLLIISQNNRGEASMSALGENGQVASSTGPIFALGGRLMVVNLEHGTVNLSLKVQGNTVDIEVKKDSFVASLNGSPMDTHTLAQLRSEMQPLMDLLNSRIELTMTDSGEVVKVSGLERLDPKMQKELAMGFLNGLALPKKPLQEGDTFTVTKSLASLFPNYSGKSAEALQGKSISTIYTLQSPIKESKGKVEAVLKGKCRQKMEDVPIDEEGTMGSADLDLQDTVVFDIQAGTIQREALTGTIMLRPNASYEDVKVTVKVNFELVGRSQNNSVALGSVPDSERRHFHGDN